VTNATTLASAVRTAGLAELVWSGGAGAAVALPWAYAEQARAAAAAASAALVLSEPRLAAPAWQAVAGVGRLTLVEDPDGSLFVARMLDQELRKHPPARAFAGSMLLRREHWWYLPRLVLLLEAPRVEPLAPRRGPLDAVLAVDDGGLQPATVRVTRWDADPLEVAGGPAAAGPAALVGQEVSTPDAERWTVHVTRGRYADGLVSGVEPPPTRELEPVPGLRARVGRHRALERACVKALRAEGHG
jgi:hypothetical protein